jgi:hypothetical protein
MFGEEKKLRMRVEAASSVHCTLTSHTTQYSANSSPARDVEQTPSSQEIYIDQKIPGPELVLHVVHRREIC